MNAYEWIIIPAVCYDKLEIQINIPNTSNPSTEVLLLLFVERNCLRIRPWDSSPFFLTSLGIYIYIYLSYICHFVYNHRTSKSKIMFPPTWARFLCWLILFNGQPPTSKVVQRNLFHGFMSKELSRALSPIGHTNLGVAPEFYGCYGLGRLLTR